MAFNRRPNRNTEHINQYLADSYVKPLHTFYEQVEKRKTKYGVRNTAPGEEKEIERRLANNAKYGGCV